KLGYSHRFNFGTLQRGQSGKFSHEDRTNLGIQTGRVCTNTSGDAGMKKAVQGCWSRRLKRRPLLQTSSPLNHQLRTYIGIGTANGGTSAGPPTAFAACYDRRGTEEPAATF